MAKPSTLVQAPPPTEETAQACLREMQAVLTKYGYQLQVGPQVTIVINGQTVVPQIQLVPVPPSA